MANGLLNQLLLQQSEQTAPMQRRFNLQNFLTGATQMSNQIARQEERQRQNSLRNLIAAREQEGIGFDQLSNEAAKYDMNAANTMRDEFRNSYKFNQQQSDAELARFKREMADYWFGEVLRRARKDGKPDGELKNITYEAASMIAPYDSELAYRLLMQSEKMYTGEEKRKADMDKAKLKAQREKQFKDDHAMMSNQKQSIRDNSTNNVNPDIRQKSAAELDRINLLESELAHQGYPIYTWMTGFLRNHKGGYRAAIQELKDNYDWEKPNYMEYSTLGQVDDSNEDRIALEKAGVIGKSTSSNTPKIDNNKSKLGSDDYMTIGENGQKYYSFVNRSKSSLGEIVRAKPDVYKKLLDALRSVETLDDAEALSAALDEYKNAEGAVNTDNIKKRLDEKKKAIESLKQELGEITPENKLIAKTLTARGKQAEARRLRQMGTVATGLLSGTPFSIVDNMLMVQSPDYQISEAMQNTAYRIVNGDWSTEILSAFGSQKGFLGRLAQNATVYDMLAAGARDDLNTIRPIYKAMLDECKDESERKNLKNALKKTFGWPNNLFKALEDPKGSLGTAETIKKAVENFKNQKVNVYDNPNDDDGSGLETDVNTEGF